MKWTHSYSQCICEYSAWHIGYTPSKGDQFWWWFLTLIRRYRKLAHLSFLFQGYLQWSYTNLQVLYERCHCYWICLAVGAGATLLSTRNGRNEQSLFSPNCLLTCLFIFLNTHLFPNSLPEIIPLIARKVKWPLPYPPTILGKVLAYSLLSLRLDFSL